MNEDLKFSELVVILEALKTNNVTKEVIEISWEIPEYLWNKYSFVRMFGGINYKNVDSLNAAIRFVKEEAKKEFPEYFEEEGNADK